MFIITSRQSPSWHVVKIEFLARQQSGVYIIVLKYGIFGDRLWFSGIVEVGSLWHSVVNRKKHQVAVVYSLYVEVPGSKTKR